MTVWKSICTAMSIYSIIPMPSTEWTGNNLRYAIAALPLVGVIIGGLLLLWQWLCALLGLSDLLFGAVACLLPLFVSGGIHLDGFCDTVDALASHQSRERKLAILKDTQAGAFAVIYLCAYMLLSLALYTELAVSGAMIVVALGFVLSRALTALTTLILPNARSNGMLAGITRPVNAKAAGVVSLIFAGLAIALMMICHMQAAIGAVLLCLLTLLVYRHMVLKQFGGITGDTSGFFLQICELAILLGAVGGFAAQRVSLC